MNELGAKDLQPFLQFSDLMLNVVFDGGSFMKTITQVDVHEHLKLARRRRANQCLLEKIVHPRTDCNAGIEKTDLSDFGFGNEWWKRLASQRNLRADSFAAGYDGRYDLEL